MLELILNESLYKATILNFKYTKKGLLNKLTVPSFYLMEEKLKQSCINSKSYKLFLNSILVLSSVFFYFSQNKNRWGATIN